jgi:CRISPR-associated endonuclease/helicase Cas3
MMTDTTYTEWFGGVTGNVPHEWQRELGEDAVCRDRMIRIPTGFGKTAGVVLAWLRHRVEHENAAWPRRLVFCLPMRVLVEQTEGVIEEWVKKAGLDVPVFTLLGGREAARWVDKLDRPAILVGTQDMLLSRALNRGYASARGLWPMEFGALHHDVLWVTDEVQLMDTGLATTTQFAAFRSDDEAKGRARFRPAFTWWMSATLQQTWLSTVDFGEASRALPRTAIPPESRTGGLWSVRKSLTFRRDAGAPEEIAKLSLAEHRAETLSLVIVNTVDRAAKVFAALEKLRKKEKNGVDLKLVHSRFRGAERRGWNSFLRKEATVPEEGRILVATQVVEAGVDLSAGVLVTDLAPWSSLVQRFGRAARYAEETGKVFVVGDVPAKDIDARPYELRALAAAAEALSDLGKAEADVGPATLEAFEARLAEGDGERVATLYPYQAAHVLRRPDFDDLFDTSADLSGADLDVGRYIRSGDERDVTVFWRPVEAEPGTLEQVPWPSRDELCPVPVGELRKFLEKTEKKAYVFDYLSGTWARRRANDRLVPGMTVLLDSAAGGYRSESGWEPSSKDDVIPVYLPDSSKGADEMLEASLASDDDALSLADGYKTIRLHGYEAGLEALRLAASFGIPKELGDLLALAARWHDAGKAHPTFQEAISAGARSKDAAFGGRCDLAKAPRGSFRSPPYPERPGFRHELVSALLLFEVLRRRSPQHAALLGPHAELFALTGIVPVPVTLAEQLDTHPLADELSALSAEQFDLVAYLVCAHHGKVRGRWASTPQDMKAEHGGIHGVVSDVDRTPAFTLPDANGSPVEIPSATLSLSAAALGVGARYGASWTDRTSRLLDRHGPFGLAFLETLLRVADWRASALPAEKNP